VSTNRLETFADGVFAIAATLLILNVDTQVASDAAIGTRLLHIWPSYAGYVVSFLTIGIIWANHHTVMNQIARVDRTFLMLSVLFLMSVAFIPFPAALVGNYPAERSAVMLYGATLVVTGLMLRALFVYAFRKGLIDAPPGLERYAAIRQLVPVAIYFLGLLLALVVPWFALAIYLCVPLLYILPTRYIAGRPLAPRTAEP